MQRYTFAVLTNAVEGQDDEFNDWYDNRHVHDVVHVPGIVAATRYKLADAQLPRVQPPHPYRYLAIYEIETDDLEKTLKALGERSGTALMPVSPALSRDRVLALVFSETTSLTTAEATDFAKAAPGS